MSNSTSDILLSSNTDLYIKMYDEMPVICMLLDAQLKVVLINDFGCMQLGYKSKELIGQAITMLYREQDQQLVVSNLKSVIDSDQSHSNRWESTRIRKDGSSIWMKETAKKMSLAPSDSPYFLLVSEDITETRYLINELEKQVSYDSLTGLLKRSKLERFIDQTILASQAILQSKHSFCFIDLDRFSVINEISGNLAGDQLLKKISALIQEEIHQEDVLARFDGDKFGLLLKNCDINKTQRILQKILHKISALQFHWENETYNLSASVGYASVDHTTKNASECIKRASTACYLAKQEGGDSIHLCKMGDKDLRQHDQKQKSISLLKWAFENNTLELHYQEIRAITVCDKQQHLEILVRLYNKDNELVYPNDFIPAAEQYGLATKLDLWVTRTALQHFNKKDFAHKVVCNLNLSGETLGSEEFVTEATALLKKCHNSNVVICFEVTETAAIANMDKAIKFIKHFKSLGCLFALDDFGSGFSSFAYLKLLPVDFLKIDGFFVKNILHDRKDLALVRAIHQVAEIFEIKTIAEFIEDEAIMTVLKGVGIDYGQGYHLHKPEKLK